MALALSFLVGRLLWRGHGDAVLFARALDRRQKKFGVGVLRWCAL